MILFLVVFCMLVAIGFGLAAAISDIRSLTIPNVYTLYIMVAFIVAFAADALTGNGVEMFLSWKSHLIAGVAVFGLTFVLFTFRLIGAGDSKLCSAFALWVGIPGLMPLFFYMAISGAVLGIATKIMNKKTLVAAPKEGSWIAQAQAGRASVPYGAAICLGAVVAFYSLGYFAPDKLALLAGVIDTENQP